MCVLKQHVIFNSGGQTGADRAGLDWAIDHGYHHGGYCPLDRRAEDGVISSEYNLIQTVTHSYYARTVNNVVISDVTVIFTLKANLEGGSKQTAEIADSHGVPWLHVHPQMDLQNLRTFIDHYKCTSINIAGRRESKAPGIYKFTYECLNILL